MVLLRRHVSFPGRKELISANAPNSLLLFLVFFPRNSPLLPHVDQSRNKNQYTWRTAVTVAVICLLHGLVVVFVSGTLLLARPHYLGKWANALGIMATILAAIQYLPQIWLTWHLGHVGSLSIPMMLIQTPGSFVWSFSLYTRLGVGGWSSWGVFLVTGCLQGCLLVMSICFQYKARQAGDMDSDNVSRNIDHSYRNVLIQCSRVQLVLLDAFQTQGPVAMQKVKVARLWRMKIHPL